MKGHKWFAALYDRMAVFEEKKFLGAVRRDLLQDLTGDVLEIGAGTGMNFQHYPKGAGSSRLSLTRTCLSEPGSAWRR